MRLTVRDRPAGAAADTITLRATPPIPPIGVPIDTAAGPIGEGVHLGAPLNTRYVAPNRNEPVQMVALDRTDLARVANNSYTGDAAGTAQLVSDVAALSSSDLVIITTPASSQSRAITDPQAQANVNQAVAAIGGAALPAAVLGNATCLAYTPQFCTNFSVIGVPGQDAGTAYENAGLTQVAGRNVGAPGSLVGYLQADQRGRYHYVNGDFAAFDTSTAGSTGARNVMAINGQTITSDLLPIGQAGFHLVTMESDTLDLQLNVTYAVSGTDLSDTDAASGLSAIDGLLAQAANDPTQLVFLQSIGSVQRNDAGQAATLAWNAVATDLSGLGSHAFYFNALNGQGDGGTFAFVGPGDAPSFLSPWAKTATTLATGTPGHLVGVLARNTQSQYYPKFAALEPSLDFSLPFVAYQPTQAWPYRDAAHLPALTCIAQALGLPPSADREQLPQPELHLRELPVLDLGLTSRSRTSRPPPTRPARTRPSIEQEFNDAQGQITQELRAGAGVSKLIENLQSPLGTSADAANANVLEIAQAIQSTVGNSNANASGDTAQVIDDLMYVASAIVPEGGAALGAGASIYGLVNAALDDASGGPLLDTVETNATQLLVDFAEDYEAVWSQTATTGNILLSDWGKLDAAYQRSLTSWSWSAQDTTNGADALTAAAKLFTFEALVPLEYQTYDFGDSGYRQTLPVPPPDGRAYQCPSKSLQFPDQTVPQEFQPFTGGPTPGLSVVTQAGPVTDLWMLGSTNPAFLSNDPDTRTNASSYIPQTLYSAMFSDPVNEDISSPVLPSELRFDLDVYDAPSTLTANGGFSPDVYCNVNGQRPS